MMAYLFGMFVALVLLSIFSPMLYKKLKVKMNVAANKISDALDNPIEEAQYDIQVAKNELQGAKNDLAKLLTDVKLLEHQEKDKAEEVDKYQRLAETYAGKKDEDNVRVYVKKKGYSERRLTQIRAELKTLKDISEVTKANISNHEQRIEDAENKTGELTARYNNAKLKEKYVAQEFSDIGLKSLSSFESKVEGFEANVDAKAEVFSSKEQEVLNDDSTEDEVNRLMGR